jgi:hypothetical protein
MISKLSLPVKGFWGYGADAADVDICRSRFDVETAGVSTYKIKAVRQRRLTARYLRSAQ